jgi:hypothetical protein
MWHDYMSEVVGTDCVPFPQPTEPLGYQPFFGKYAATGQSAVTSPEVQAAPTPNHKPKKPGHRPHPGAPGAGAPGVGEEPESPAPEPADPEGTRTAPAAEPYPLTPTGR